MNKRTILLGFLLAIAALLSAYRGSGRINDPVNPPSQVAPQIDYPGAYD